MRELLRATVALGVAATFAGCGFVRANQAPGPPVPDPITPTQEAIADTAVIADFNSRLENYVTRQRALLKGSPIVEDATPEQILARQKTLAAELQSIRRNAKQGDIFTPQVATFFRRLLAPEFKGREGRETREQIREGSPTELWLRVNAEYPQKQPLSTVPPNLLAKLPQLPRDVEYRIVGRHLMLRDVDANIIVDFIYNALPSAPSA